MELHHLRHFIAVAEELHFGRAARRLNMAQPPLSQSIKRLEASLGVQLFDRSRQHVALTKAGAVFLEECREALQRIERAAILARRTAAGTRGRLSVGFVSRALFCGLPRALREFREKWPDVEVRLDEMSSKAQVEALGAGALDLGLLHAPFAGSEEFALRVVERSRFVAVVPSGSKLAGRPWIRLAELAGEDFVVTPQDFSPALQSRVMAACRGAGFTPRVVQESRQENTMLSLVASGIGVALMPENSGAAPVDGVTYLPVQDMPADLYSDLAIAWLAQGASPALEALVASISGVAALSRRSDAGRRPPTGS